MMNLFEMMQSAQSGQAMQNLARQFGLSEKQTYHALDALLPALTIGLQRQTQDPNAFGNLARMMTGQQYGALYDADGDGIPDNAAVMGNNVLSQLFGSKEVSNALAAQAAASSGVAQAILKKMLPVVAAMVMGGLFKSTSNQGLGGIFGQFAEMMQGRTPGGQPQAQPPQAAPANPLEAILGGLFGSGGTQQPQAQPQAQPSANPMEVIFGQILGGMFGGAQPGGPAPTPQAGQARAPQMEPEPEATPAPTGEVGPGSIGLDALNQMFEHGRQVQDDHQNALKSILDAMLGGGQRR